MLWFAKQGMVCVANKICWITARSVGLCQSTCCWRRSAELRSVGSEDRLCHLSINSDTHRVRLLRWVSASIRTREHTLEDCSAKESECRVPVGLIGFNLSPLSLIAVMLASGEGWEAAVSFCEEVMLQKESAERDR